MPVEPVEGVLSVTVTVKVTGPGAAVGGTVMLFVKVLLTFERTSETTEPPSGLASIVTPVMFPLPGMTFAVIRVVW